MMDKNLSRRIFIRKSIAAGVTLATMNQLSACSNYLRPGSKNLLMKPGLVTYLWAKDWDLPTLIENCARTGLLGVELRTQHAHGVESTLNAKQRAEVKQRFSDSPVTCLGYGSNYEYHSPDQKILRQNIEKTKEYIKLCRDIGATGLKVKPNGLPAQIAPEKTIAQIAASLNEVGKYAQDFGQLIRVEAHGPLTELLPNMKAIFDQVTEPNVKICWNCNPPDVSGAGIVENFNMVKKWLGDTVHIHELNRNDYPYQEIFNLFAGINYKGWLLLEGSSTNPEDKISAMHQHLESFNKLKANISKI